MQKIVLVLIISIITLLLFGCTQPPVCGDGICNENSNSCPQDCETTYLVEFKVGPSYNPDSSIENAKINISDNIKEQTLFTDNAGYTSIKLPKGKYNLTTSKEGYKNYTYNFYIDSPNSFNITLEFLSDLDNLNKEALIAQEEVLNNFSKSFAEDIEKWLTLDENEPPFPIETILVDKNLTFEELKKEFKQQIFLVDSNNLTPDIFIELIPRRIYNNFTENYYGKYHYHTNYSGEQRQVLFNSIKKAFEKQLTEKDWLDVNCTDNSCPNGNSFNIILPFHLIDKDSNLPKIIMDNVITQESVTIDIIPRKEITIQINSDIFKKIYALKK